MSQNGQVKYLVKEKKFVRLHNHSRSEPIKIKEEPKDPDEEAACSTELSRSHFQEKSTLENADLSPECDIQKEKKEHSQVVTQRDSSTCSKSKTGLKHDSVSCKPQISAKSASTGVAKEQDDNCKTGLNKSTSSVSYKPQSRQKSASHDSEKKLYDESGTRHKSASKSDGSERKRDDKSQTSHQSASDVSEKKRDRSQTSNKSASDVSEKKHDDGFKTELKQNSVSCKSQTSQKTVSDGSEKKHNDKSQTSHKSSDGSGKKSNERSITGLKQNSVSCKSQTSHKSAIIVSEKKRDDKSQTSHKSASDVSEKKLDDKSQSSHKSASDVSEKKLDDKSQSSHKSASDVSEKKLDDKSQSSHKSASDGSEKKCEDKSQTRQKSGSDGSEKKVHSKSQTSHKSASDGSEKKHEKSQTSHKSSNDGSGMKHDRSQTSHKSESIGSEKKRDDKSQSSKKSASDGSEKKHEKSQTSHKSSNDGTGKKRDDKSQTNHKSASDVSTKKCDDGFKTELKQNSVTYKSQTSQKTVSDGSERKHDNKSQTSHKSSDGSGMKSNERSMTGLKQKSVSCKSQTSHKSASNGSEKKLDDKSKTSQKSASDGSEKKREDKYQTSQKSASDVSEKRLDDKSQSSHKSASDGSENTREDKSKTRQKSGSDGSEKKVDSKSQTSHKSASDSSEKKHDRSQTSHKSDSIGSEKKRDDKSQSSQKSASEGSEKKHEKSKTNHKSSNDRTGKKRDDKSQTSHKSTSDVSEKKSDDNFKTGPKQKSGSCKSQTSHKPSSGGSVKKRDDESGTRHKSASDVSEKKRDDSCKTELKSTLVSCKSQTSSSQSNSSKSSSSTSKSIDDSSQHFSKRDKLTSSEERNTSAQHKSRSIVHHSSKSQEGYPLDSEHSDRIIQKKNDCVNVNDATVRHEENETEDRIHSVKKSNQKRESLCLKMPVKENLSHQSETETPIAELSESDTDVCRKLIVKKVDLKSADEVSENQESQSTVQSNVQPCELSANDNHVTRRTHLPSFDDSDNANTFGHLRRNRERAQSKIQRNSSFGLVRKKKPYTLRSFFDIIVTATNHFLNPAYPKYSDDRLEQRDQNISSIDANDEPGDSSSNLSKETHLRQDRTSSTDSHLSSRTIESPTREAMQPDLNQIVQNTSEKPQTSKKPTSSNKRIFDAMLSVVGQKNRTAVKAKRSRTTISLSGRKRTLSQETHFDAKKSKMTEDENDDKCSDEHESKQTSDESVEKLIQIETHCDPSKSEVDSEPCHSQNVPLCSVDVTTGLRKSDRTVSHDSGKGSENLDECISSADIESDNAQEVSSREVTMTKVMNHSDKNSQNQYEWISSAENSQEAVSQFDTMVADGNAQYVSNLDQSDMCRIQRESEKNHYTVNVQEVSCAVNMTSTLNNSNRTISDSFGCNSQNGYEWISFAENSQECFSQFTKCQDNVSKTFQSTALSSFAAPEDCAVERAGKKVLPCVQVNEFDSVLKETDCSAVANSGPVVSGNDDVDDNDVAPDLNEYEEMVLRSLFTSEETKQTNDTRKGNSLKTKSNKSVDCKKQEQKKRKQVSFANSTSDKSPKVQERSDMDMPVAGTSLNALNVKSTHSQNQPNNSKPIKQENENISSKVHQSTDKPENSILHKDENALTGAKKKSLRRKKPLKRHLPLLEADIEDLLVSIEHEKLSVTPPKHTHIEKATLKPCNNSDKSSESDDDDIFRSYLFSSETDSVSSKSITKPPVEEVIGETSTDTLVNDESVSEKSTDQISEHGAEHMTDGIAGSVGDNIAHQDTQDKDNSEEAEHIARNIKVEPVEDTVNFLLREGQCGVSLKTEHQENNDYVQSRHSDSQIRERNTSQTPPCENESNSLLMKDDGNVKQPNVTPYLCTKCAKSFKNASSLKTHMVFHGPKHHKCDVCERPFYTAAHLKRHMQIHTGENSWTCSICNKFMLREESYQNHMATHRKSEEREVQKSRKKVESKTHSETQGNSAQCKSEPTDAIGGGSGPLEVGKIKTENDQNTEIIYTNQSSNNCISVKVERNDADYVDANMATISQESNEILTQSNQSNRGGISVKVERTADDHYGNGNCNNNNNSNNQHDTSADNILQSVRSSIDRVDNIADYSVERGTPCTGTVIETHKTTSDPTSNENVHEIVTDFQTIETVSHSINNDAYSSDLISNESVHETVNDSQTIETVSQCSAFEDDASYESNPISTESVSETHETVVDSETNETLLQCSSIEDHAYSTSDLTSKENVQETVIDSQTNETVLQCSDIEDDACPTSDPTSNGSIETVIDSQTNETVSQCSGIEDDACSMSQPTSTCSNDCVNETHETVVDFQTNVMASPCSVLEHDASCESKTTSTEHVVETHETIIDCQTHETILQCSAFDGDANTSSCSSDEPTNPRFLNVENVSQRTSFSFGRSLSKIKSQTRLDDEKECSKAEESGKPEHLDDNSSCKGDEEQSQDSVNTAYTDCQQYVKDVEICQNSSIVSNKEMSSPNIVRQNVSEEQLLSDVGSDVDVGNESILEDEHYKSANNGDTATLTTTVVQNKMSDLLKNGEDSDHVCHICERVFKSEQTLINHHWKYHEKCKCEICGKEFKNKVRLRQHMKTHTDNRVKCFVCGKMLSSIKYMNNHMCIHTGNKRYKCSKCKICFHRTSDLEHHKRTQHIEQSRKDSTKLCSPKIDTEKDSSLNNSESSHSPLSGVYKLTKISDSKKVDSGQSASVTGSDEEDGNNSCENTLSPSPMVTEPSISQLLNVDSIPGKSKDKPRKPQISYDSDVFSNALDVVMLKKSLFKPLHPPKHKVITSNKETEQSESNKITEKTTENTPDDMEHPIVTDHMNAPNECQSMTNIEKETSLEQPSESDSSPSTVTCEVCSKVMASMKTLKVHMTIHTGEKSLNCPLCNESFYFRSELKKHKQRAHAELTDENAERDKENTYSNKTHQEKQISSQSDTQLSSHSDTQVSDHNDTRRFRCITCGEYFCHPSELKKHSQTVHFATAQSSGETTSDFSETDHEKVNAECLKTVNQKNTKSSVCKNSTTKQSVGRVSYESNFLNEALDTASASLKKPLKKSSKLKEKQVTLSENVLEQNEERSPSVNETVVSDSEITNNINTTEPISDTVAKDSSSQSPKSAVTDDIHKHVCHVCNKQCRDRQALQHHLIIHRKKTYKCDVCSKLFYCLSGKNAHMAVHTGGRPTKCIICKKILVGSLNLRRHMRTHSNRRPFQCKDCPKAFITAAELRSHRFQHGTMDVKCDMCDKHFKTPELMKRHMKRQHTNPMIHICEFCGKSFRRKSRMEKHRQNHKDKTSYNCYACGLSMPNAEALKDHITIHTDKDSFKCHLCEKEFPYFEDLKQHLFSHPGQKAHTCDICGKGFKGVQPLKFHMRMHSGEKPYACEICCKSFSQLSHMKTHQKVHKDKDIECHFCDSTFVSHKDLESHMITHGKVKSHECEVCKCRFYAEKLLQLHKENFCNKSGKEPGEPKEKKKHGSKSHNGKGEKVDTSRVGKDVEENQRESEKIYSCPYCEKTYKQQKNLKRHIARRHTKVNIENSQEAEKSHQVSNASSVKKSKATEKLYRCDQCGKKYSEEKQLENHFAKKHKDSNSPSEVLPENVNESAKQSNPEDTLDVSSEIAETGLENAIRDERKFKCQYCKRSFFRKKNLLRHTQKRHNVNSIDTSDSFENESSKEQGKKNSKKNNSTCSSTVISGQSENETLIQNSADIGVLVNDVLTSQEDLDCDDDPNPTNIQKDLNDLSTIATTVNDVSEIPSENVNVYNCQKCSRTCSSLKSLKRHFNRRHCDSEESQPSHNVVPEIYCEEAPKTLTDSNMSVTDVSSESFDITDSLSTVIEGADSYRCVTCVKSFTSPERLEKHNRKHEKDKKENVCEKCGKNYPNAELLNKHIQMRHIDSKTSKPDSPRKTNATNSCKSKDKSRHSQTSKPDSPKKTSSKSKDKSADSQTLKPDSPRKISSKSKDKSGDSQTSKPDSPRKTSSKSKDKSGDSQTSKPDSPRKKSAIVSSNSKNRYSCIVCAKVFQHKNQLLNHFNIHTGEKPFQCKDCDKCYGDAGSLNAHEARHTGRRPHSCDLCGKKFYQTSALIFHVRRHTGEKPYECIICGNKSTESGGLVRHMKTHTGRKPHKCDLCSKSFSEKSTMRAHMLTHTGEKPYECDVCTEAFSSKRNLKDHMNTHTGDLPYECDHCEKRFPTRSNLKWHKDHLIEERNFACDQCQATFKTKSELKSHKKTHGERSHECEECGKLFLIKSTLEKHKLIHSNLKPYKCNTCDFACKDEGYLKRHQLIHTEREREFPCIVCEKAFFTKAVLKYHLKSHTYEGTVTCLICGVKLKGPSLQSHMLIHENEKPFECTVCDRRFRQKSHLTVHIRTHTGKKPYKCIVCPERFSHSSSLDSHMKQHTGEQPKLVKCPECNKVLRGQGGLREHMKTHSDKRPFKCPLCSQTFKRADSVKSHMVVHTKEKTWECEVCGKKLSQRSSLVTHLRVHTGERPYKCTQCNKDFTQASHLRTHMNGVHQKERGHKCKKCGNGFKTSAALKSHLATHAQIKSHECPICHKMYGRPGSLKSHMRNMHSDSDANHECEKCGKTFKHANSLKGHMRIHTGEKPYKCDQCDEAFSRLDYLKKHKLSHTGERPFSCSLCEAKFTTSGSLKSHMSTHSETRYSCDQCKKSFKGKKSLADHKRIHKGEVHPCSHCTKTFATSKLLRSHERSAHSGASYECEICKKVFPRKDTMRAHMKTHGEKTFKCDKCGKMFQRKSQLDIHWYNHNPDAKSFKCEICGKAFATASFLKKHKLSHEDDLPFHCSVCGQGFTQKGNMKKHIESKHQDHETDEESSDEDGCDDENSGGDEDSDPDEGD